MTRSYFIAALSLVFLSTALCGCSGAKADKLKRRSELIAIGRVFARFSLDDANIREKRRAMNTEDLSRFVEGDEDRQALQRLKQGQYVFIWGVSMNDMPAGPGKTVLAYAAGTPDQGGYVLLGDTSVILMTPEEFRAATHATSAKHAAKPSDVTTPVEQTNVRTVAEPLTKQTAATQPGVAPVTETAAARFRRCEEQLLSCSSFKVTFTIELSGQGRTKSMTGRLFVAASDKVRLELNSGDDDRSLFVSNGLRMKRFSKNASEPSPKGLGKFVLSSFARGGILMPCLTGHLESALTDNFADPVKAQNIHRIRGNRAGHNEDDAIAYTLRIPKAMPEAMAAELLLDATSRLPRRRILEVDGDMLMSFTVREEYSSAATNETIDDEAFAIK